MITERERFIAIVNNDILQPSDAIILLEGDGLNRYQKAVELYNSGIANIIVFSGNIVDYQYGSFPFSDVLPLMLQAGIPKDAIFHENKSLNTREQAIEVVRLSLIRHWKRLVLLASPEHQYRAYLTFLREILDTKSEMVLYNAPASNLPWFTLSQWDCPYNRLEQEFERIEKYTQLGHLATYQEAIEYQKWKELQ
jgi:uncharacterized SAM-binding protein YcdF (DUF218 family)